MFVVIYKLIFQFLKMLVGYNFSRIGKEWDKYINWGQPTLTQKREENVPKF